MLIVAITGMPGAGKSTAAKALEVHGFELVVMGDVIREETRRRGLEPNEKNTGKVMLELRREYGPGAVAEVCLRSIKAMKEKVVIVDGLRSLRGGGGLRQPREGQGPRHPRVAGEALQATEREGEERRAHQQGELRRAREEGAYHRGGGRGRPGRRRPLQRARHPRGAREPGRRARRVVGEHDCLRPLRPRTG